MKKMLVIAVAAGLIAPAAAMADTTLYGKLHASVGSVKTTVTTAAASASNTETAVESHASRIGVKGSTALDNGLEATYGVEYGLDIDGDNSRALAARNTFVGLKGGFGEVRVGRHDTPAKLATAGLDNFADTYADMSNIVLADNLRVDNAVAYINKFGPVGVAVAHSTRTNVLPAAVEAYGSDQAGGVDANDFMVNYSNGPWYAALGHTSAQNVLKNTNVGLGWTAEAGHKVSLVHEQTKYDASIGGSKDKNTYVTGTYKVGNVGLKAGYGQSDNNVASGKVKQTTLGVDYGLGKKTSAYLLVNELKATDAESGIAGVTALKSTQTAVGLVTEF